MRFPHLQDWLDPEIDSQILEIHTENLFSLPSAAHSRLEILRERNTFSLHGVGLSLGSTDGIDSVHLNKVAEAVERYQPLYVSEHVAWNRIDGVCVPDLLPMPFSIEALRAVCGNVQRTQDKLKRAIALENISSYLVPPAADFDEPGFLGELVARTGCTLLVDLNNLHVNQLNHGSDAWSLLTRLPHKDISQWHLGGGTEVGGAWVDTHSNTVPEEVWVLYERATELVGARPTIVEWDQDLPALPVLLRLADRARSVMDQAACRPAYASGDLG